ncbi:hypothetical protein PPSIR1_41954 [Plesiocystis pacifica SIR-1]|uniref:HTH arsR-type domain-containing protein n=1 Tax=Plesiocystis pacifica SIR-1 TaxID=391625 RepID=A6G0Y2_9BACT|nr:helix-turn-helix domain-containing protein [Plesiocystis pacifica]EDM80520.1 hypothetical protein PPSIR1_41954 [Plesiocystis pacifica SIR-1]
MARKQRSKAELVLHPARMRILSALGGRHATAKELRRMLPQIPQASLYRHLRALHEGAVLEIVEEREVNGAIERSFAVRAGQGRLSPEELEHLGPDEHLDAFNVFVAMLVESFGAYVERTPQEQLGRDGAAYNLATLWLSEAERASLHAAMVELVEGALSHEPTPERRAYALASVVIPDALTPSEP